RAFSARGGATPVSAAGNRGRLRRGDVGGRDLLEPHRELRRFLGTGHERGRGGGATAGLGADAGQGTAVRLYPGPLYLDVRRPAVSGAVTARFLLGGPPTGGPACRVSHGRGELE